MKKMLSDEGINTVCQKARCPNIGECFSGKKLTFLVMGGVCTRSCGFCSVTSGVPAPLAADEPERIIKIIKQLGLRYVILTSVTRDDLADSGLGYYVELIEAVKGACKDTVLEVLTPDFRNAPDAAKTIAQTAVDVFAHNVETAPAHYEHIRPGADYKKSLSLLKGVKDHSGGRIFTKSGFMLGLGENNGEVFRMLKDLKKACCDIVTLGQYLRPDKSCAPVCRFIPPEEFEYFRNMALALGLRYVCAGPFVRSSYKAEETYFALKHMSRGGK